MLHRAEVSLEFLIPNLRSLIYFYSVSHPFLQRAIEDFIRQKITKVDLDAVIAVHRDSLCYECPPGTALMHEFFRKNLTSILSEHILPIFPEVPGTF